MNNYVKINDLCLCFSYHAHWNHIHLENHTRKGVGEGGSGEEHMYHVLEKPVDDDYEDPDKNLEKSTAAAEYEIPVPLK